MQFVSLGSPAVLLLLFMLFFATVTARKAFEGGKDMLLITMHNALDALWYVKSGKKLNDKLIRVAIYFSTRQYCSIYLQYAAVCTV